MKPPSETLELDGARVNGRIALRVPWTMTPADLPHELCQLPCYAEGPAGWWVLRSNELNRIQLVRLWDHPATVEANGRGGDGFVVAECFAWPGYGMPQHRRQPHFCTTPTRGLRLGLWG